MGYKLTRRIPGATQFKGLTRYVLVAIADYCDDDTCEGWCSYKTISSDTGMSQRGVINAVKRLEEAGELDVTRHDAGSGMANNYKITLFLGDGEGEPGADGRVNSVQIPPEQDADTPVNGVQIPSAYGVWSTTNTTTNKTPLPPSGGKSEYSFAFAHPSVEASHRVKALVNGRAQGFRDQGLMTLDELAAHNRTCNCGSKLRAI